MHRSPWLSRCKRGRLRSLACSHLPWQQPSGNLAVLVKAVAEDEGPLAHANAQRAVPRARLCACIWSTRRALSSVEQQGQSVERGQLDGREARCVELECGIAASSV